MYRRTPFFCAGRSWRRGRSIDLKKGDWMGRKGRGVTRVNRTHFDVWFNDELYGALAEFASRSDLPLNLSIRLLVERALAAAAGRTSGDMEVSLGQHLKTLGYSALASLIAIEQNQKLLISMLPDGAQRAEELWDEAATNARSRLIRIDQALAEETV
jgi:hypothetical protein